MAMNKNENNMIYILIIILNILIFIYYAGDIIKKNIRIDVASANVKISKKINRSLYNFKQERNNRSNEVVLSDMEYLCYGKTDMRNLIFNKHPLHFGDKKSLEMKRNAPFFAIDEDKMMSSDEINDVYEQWKEREQDWREKYQEEFRNIFTEVQKSMDERALKRKK